MRTLRALLLVLSISAFMLFTGCGGSNHSSSTGSGTGNNSGATNTGGANSGGTSGGTSGATNSGGSGSGTSGSNSGGTSGGTSGGVNTGGANTGGSNSGTSGGGSGTTGSNVAGEAQLTVDTIAQNLQEPWALAFAPDGRLFFTEAPGRLRVITNGTLQASPVLDLTANNAGFEGGLTGMDLDRDFASNGFLYVHYCTTDNTCHVARVTTTSNASSTTGTLDKVLLNYPAPNFDHAGGRLKVGPDGLIYLSIGDHQNDASAQNIASWDGKVIRMNTDGSPAAGNPFGSQNPYAYAIGLRDPQGLAFNASGALYATDHGPTANDEVDLITAGSNYGWPNCIGSCNNPAYVDPALNLAPTGPSLPPSGATFYSGSTIPGWNGSLLVAILGLDDDNQAHHLHQVLFNADGSIAGQQSLFVNQFGRLRDVVEGPDGFAYMSTSNYQQGSKGAPNDDRILRIHPR